MYDAETFGHFLRNLPRTPEHPCSYYPERRARLQAFLFDMRFPPECVDVLVHRGFRRSGNFHYRTACPSCDACLGYRIPVSSFRLTRSQARVARRNRALERIVISPPNPSPEKEALYLRYQYRQHFLRPGPVRAESEFRAGRTLRVMHQQMYTGSANSVEMEWRKDGSLAGFAVFDVGRSTLSAVYSVYEPDEGRQSPGTFIILDAVRWARACGLTWVHLGHFIPGHPKMDYKRRFGPAEILDPAAGAWVPADRFMASWDGSRETRRRGHPSE